MSPEVWQNSIVNFYEQRTHGDETVYKQQLPPTNMANPHLDGSYSSPRTKRMSIYSNHKTKNFDGKWLPISEIYEVPSFNAYRYRHDASDELYSLGSPLSRYLCSINKAIPPFCCTPRYLHIRFSSRTSKMRAYI